MIESRTTASVLGTSIDVTTHLSAGERVFELAAKREPAYICFATAHMLVEAMRDQGIRSAYGNARMVTPDGTPVAWCLRLLGFPHAECVSGPRLVPMLLEEAQIRGVPVGFYGGRPQTIAKMREAIARDFPRLNVAYTYSPPFRPLDRAEQEQAIREMRESGARLVFVGLGSPKQELWMREWSPAADCVFLGVGAAFEFLAGEKVMPPPWIQKLGLTWLVRLSQEPRRLAKRNFYYSPLFAFHFARQRWNSLFSTKPVRRAHES